MADALTPRRDLVVDRTPLAGRVEAGRAFSGRRRVRWGDVDRFRRLRLDSLARYLQDVANDDARDAGLDDGQAFVVRRTVVDVVRPPRPGEVVELTTFCGGLGRRWAERRTTIEGDAGGHVETASLWIAVDPRSGRPARLDERFTATYGSAADGRTVSASLRHPAPPDDGPRRPWPLRSTDHDPLGHVNNAATWEPVEDELDRQGLVPVRAELEYRAAIDPDDEVDVVTDRAADVLAVWVLAGPVVRASALVLTTSR